MASYGAVGLEELRAEAPARQSRRSVVFAGLAVLAVAVVGAVVLVSYGQAAPEQVELVDPGYVKWLKTLSGPVDYQTGKEYDDRFSASNMNHADISELLPSALPHAQAGGDLQGADFAKDVTPSIAQPVDMDEINKLPAKLRKIKAKIAQEKEVVAELKKIVDAHSLPMPESVVVHVGQRGPRGAKGPRGFRGPRGDQGTKGPTGPQGPSGERGPRGPQGPTGPKGDKGPVGPKGRKGYQGKLGRRGTVGIEGGEGEVGARGGQGGQGAPGPQGPNGPNGMEGPVGRTGHEGRDGRHKYLSKLLTWLATQIQEAARLIPDQFPATACLAVVDGMCYSGVHGRTNFHHAEHVCRRWGGHVFSFKTEKQWKWMADTTFLKSQNFWVGMEMRYSANGDPAHDFKFKDKMSNSFAMTKWNPGEPNGFRNCGRCEPCVEGLTNMKMNDISCSARRPYVCARELEANQKVQ